MEKAIKKKNDQTKSLKFLISFWMDFGGLQQNNKFHGCLSHISRLYASIIFKSISVELYVHMAIPEIILLIVILK